MRIDGVSLSSINSGVQESQNQSAQQQPVRQEQQSQDRVELSQTSLELSGSRLAESSEARAGRVAEIGNQVSSGNYQVNAYNVAESLIGQNTGAGR